MLIMSIFGLGEAELVDFAGIFSYVARTLSLYCCAEGFLNTVRANRDCHCNDNIHIDNSVLSASYDFSE